ncbi:hypothetical protein E3O55_05660 [Cryobacterium sp. MDB1-18-2]|uniref:hypothetical protein n=1 Tax=unclassified Cryobacterium TaxID=2649013 RepID=UPI0010699C85|nr:MULTISPECIES: hypothetical protein [unclassified Cryobacterium]TFC32380.1 hypothetical protein E3O55_05660 [Cryobacterium sp. MDB1-18-2]TFC46105.1 hypothetical protein E3O50_02045 [Cryobacterium sp. MDB1-18-1]
MERPPVTARLVFLLLGGIALLAGLNGALLLLGLWAPVDSTRLTEVHGPLMVFGFVGTVVVLERAVAVRRTWAYLSPGLLGAGGIALISPLPVVVGQAALVAGTTMLLAIYSEIWRKQGSVSTAVQVLGALAGLMATIFWLRGIGIPQLAPLLILFLVLTIAGERLELSRISPTVNRRAEQWMLGISLALSFGSVVALVWPIAGYPLLGAGMLALVAWLFRHDIATRMVRSVGLPRYMAWCLLAGYGWLAVVGGIWLLRGPVYSGPGYDAMMHAVFLGFVMSMIMAHAPTILPAVLRRPLPYRPVMYLPASLLHVSLLVRVLFGDAYGRPVLVQWGGVFNIVAVLLFVAIAAVSVLRGTTVPPVRTTPRNTATPSAAPLGRSLL